MLLLISLKTFIVQCKPIQQNDNNVFLIENLGIGCLKVIGVLNISISEEKMRH